MKTAINFTTSRDDTQRFDSRETLREFYRSFGCSGLEVMPLEQDAGDLLRPDMVLGVHTCAVADWMGQEQEVLLQHYQKDLDYACRMDAEYVVFHITQVSLEECLSYRFVHSDEEVVDAAVRLINRLLDGKDYHFCFLMENLWWPGLNFLRPDMAERLLAGVHYKKKGLMLDTGHFMNTNQNLRTQEEAVGYLQSMLDRHRDLLPEMKGIHLQCSLSGAYMKNYLKNPMTVKPEPGEYSRQMYEHVFHIDEHRPFTAKGVKKLVERIAPEYLTYEYITRDREEHRRFLEQGVRALQET